MLSWRGLWLPFVNEGENPGQYTDRNQTAHDYRPAVPGRGTTVENIGAGDLTVYAGGLTKRLFNTSYSGEAPPEFDERLMLHEHLTGFRASHPAHFARKNAQQLGIRR